MRSTVLLIGLLALAGCESAQPATRAGMALDHAGTVTGNTVATGAQVTGNAVANGAQATGNALDRTGTYVRDKVTNP